jgi:hypothetical protein
LSFARWAFGDRELSAALRLRDTEKLVERHITPMLNEGLLVRRYPEAPTHPDQAYRTAQEPLPPES